jgi:nucleoside-diphosphate-sugar epimerase
MTVLVTGASGLLGRHVVDQILEMGERPRALVAPEESTEPFTSVDVDVRSADIRERAALEAAMRGVERVVHCAARTGPWGPEEEYDQTNVRALDALIEIAAAEQVRHVVHVSSVTVHGNDVRGAADENSPTRTERNPYSRSKIAGERRLRELVTRFSVPVSIVRPGWIYGPRDTASFARTATMIRDGRMVMLGSGSNHLPLIYVTDAARGALQAVYAGGPSGRAYILVNDEPVTQRDYVAAIARELGVAMPTKRVPYRLALALGAGFEAAWTLARSEHPPPLTRYGVKLLGGENRFDISRARRELGFNPSVSMAEGVARTIAWYRGTADQTAVARSA